MSVNEDRTAYISEHTAKVIIIPSSVLVGFHTSTSVTSTNVLLLDSFDSLASTSSFRYCFCDLDGLYEKCSISESYMLGGYRLKLSVGHSFF